MTRLNRKMKGTGITRYEQVSWCASDQEAQREVEQLLGVYVCPKSDFAGWLDAQEGSATAKLQRARARCFVGERRAAP